MHALDLAVNTYVANMRTANMTEFMYLVTHLFDTIPFICIALAVSVYIYLVRGVRYAYLFAGVITLGSLMVWILKVFLNVARPSSAVMEAFGKSFPSGHATIATIFFVMLIFVFDDYFKPLAQKVFNFFCIAFIFVIAFSRVYLGVHWVSDVVGGILIGTVFVYFSTEIFRAITKV